LTDFRGNPTVPGACNLKEWALRSWFAALRPIFGLTVAALLIAGFVFLPALQAHAQGQSLSFIRDTEAERVLRSKLDPILLAAGLVPQDVHLYLVNDPSINAFVAEGQNMFLNTGLLMTLETPNQITGVMAHETGHMAHGDLVRAGAGIKAATIPLLLSMAAGLAAIIAGAGAAGTAIMMAGQQIAERTFLAYSRTVEANADQAGMRFLTATHQSGEGMLQVFKKFEDQEILSSQHIDPFAQTHPAPADRIAALQDLVDASPYRDVKDSPETIYAFDMMRAKLRGYIQPSDVTIRQYPVSNTSKPARYARAMAYFKTPDMQNALGEIEGLLKDEPENPYFLEMYGQIKVEMGKVEEGIVPYRKAVEILPDAPLIRVALGAALLGTENAQYAREAVTQLQMGLAQDFDDPYGWYELAQAYSRTGQPGKADLATAERFFVVDDYRDAIQFATRAQRVLPPASTDWQRAVDIVAISQTQQKAIQTRGGR
jgi:predicted Zn-dependent protease